MSTSSSEEDRTKSRNLLLHRPSPPAVVHPMPAPRPLQVRQAPPPVPARKPLPWVPKALEKAQKEHKARLKQQMRGANPTPKPKKRKDPQPKKRKERQPQQPAEPARPRPQLSELAKQKSKLEIMAEKELETHRNNAVQQQQQAVQKVQEARNKAMDARMQAWKKKSQQSRKRTSATAVERVPKLSALLARAGGDEARDYLQQITLARLAVWNSQAGDRWQILRHHFNGQSIAETLETQTKFVKDVPLMDGLETFRKDPETYLAFYFSPKNPTQFTYVLRAGTIRYQPQDLRSDGVGSHLILRHMYKRLEPFPDNLLPQASTDKVTDTLTFQGKKLIQHNQPLLPGRGMGLADEANMEFMGIHGPLPDHIRQGSTIGDCWLLSAIACLADFPWAVERLFRKQKIQDLPVDAPNKYIVTLWDLKTWKEVDVVVDERLPVQPNEPDYLLGAKPSRDGKFWVPYLEKAIAVHCGGYDKINGGNCTDAWPMLTGSRNQFLIQKNAKTGKYTCNAKYNPQTHEWQPHSNSPKDTKQTLWQVEWPKVGGGGDRTLELDQDELFERIVLWDETNYLIGAATAGTSDKNSTDGLVDNHAYSVIDTQQNVCNTGTDLLLLRNPWGQSGDLKTGLFRRSGPGWKRYPSIQKELNPTTEDNGLCWVTKKEFFQYFPSIYLCAMNMTRLQDDDYVNDLTDHFDKTKTTATKRTVKAKEEATEIRPLSIEKTSLPNSGYKVVEETFGGGIMSYSLNKQTVTGRSIAMGVKAFRANPDKYMAIHFQKNMVAENWPTDKQQYTFIYRQGTKGMETDKNKKGDRTILINVPIKKKK